MNEHHYQRIDKGQPRTRRSVPRRRNPATNALQAIPEGLQAHEVLDRYLTEETTSQIAKSYGVARKSLVAWLRETVPQEWHKVQVLRALCRKEDSDEGLECASDPLSLARAREMLKSAQWELERLDSATYGPKQEITHITADLGERLRRARERVVNSVDNSGVIEHTSVMSSPAALPNPAAQSYAEGTEALLPAEGPIQSKK